MKQRPVSISIAILLHTTLSLLPPVQSASNFKFIGPQLTLTLKEPFDTTKPSSSSSFDSGGGSDPNTGSLDFDVLSNRFLSLSGLSPTLTYRIESASSPVLPGLLGSFLKSCAGCVGYDYATSKSRPAFWRTEWSVGGRDDDDGGGGGIGGVLKALSLDVTTNYEWKERGWGVGMKLGKGRGAASFLLAKLSSKTKKSLDSIEASYKMMVPLSTISSVTIRPQFDFTTCYPSCLISGETATRRTTAVLDLNVDDPRLQVIHRLDERNTIAPEISLTTAQIQYDWRVSLPAGGCLRARVDPTSAIHVSWIDAAAASNGNWVTEFKLPLEGTSGGGGGTGDNKGPLVGDIRVRRSFVF